MADGELFTDERVAVGGVLMVWGRGLHSSTSQLNVSRV